jgi:hypothetical protein
LGNIRGCVPSPLSEFLVCNLPLLLCVANAPVRDWVREGWWSFSCKKRVKIVGAAQQKRDVWGPKTCNARAVKMRNSYGARQFEKERESEICRRVGGLVRSDHHEHTDPTPTHGFVCRNSLALSLDHSFQCRCGAICAAATATATDAFGKQRQTALALQLAKQGGPRFKG